MEVLINGRRYVPADPEPDSVHVWYMHDNHTFTRLRGQTLDAILAQADEVEIRDPWGMLCPARLLCDGRDVRSVGPYVHSHGIDDPTRWAKGKAQWRAEVEQDADVMRLIGRE